MSAGRVALARSTVRYRVLRSWARDHVPYYRETWASDPAGLGPSTVELARQAFRLAPLATPWRPGAWSPRRDPNLVAVLTRCALVHHGYRPASRSEVLADCAPAADDLAAVRGAAWGERRRYLAVPPEGSFEREVVLRRLGAEPLCVVVGTAQEQEALESAVPALRSTAGARSPARVTRSVDGARPLGPALLTDHVLGDLAFWAADCASWHVPAAVWWVRNGSAGPVFTRLSRRAPVLIDVYSPTWVGWRVRDCVGHRSRVLSPPLEPG